MSIARIIVPVTGTERDAAALAAAFAAAKPFNAHVLAMIVHPDPRLSVPFMGAPLAPQVVQSLVDATAEVNVTATKAARASLAVTARTAGVEIVDNPRKTEAVTCSFAEMEGFFAGSIAKAARLSDLVVFGPIATADGPDVNECFVEILTKTDKPVLLSANGGRKLTRSIAVAWDGGASACHAITGALPFLKRAEAVTILHVGEPLQDSQSGFSIRTSLGELKEYLSLHGVTPAVQNFEGGTKSTGEALLDAALAVGADMLVMGGYGHSRLRETIFGGVTAHIRWHAELPVLMVH
jgi:nucleotide-binding universal stress UspA family protein